MKYWKIGSRWHANGAKDKSILDVFLKNSIVFVKEANTKGKMMSEMKNGDVIAITDGINIVATAKAVSAPMYLNQITLNLNSDESMIFDYNEEKDDTVAVQVDFVRTQICIPYRQGAFCEIRNHQLILNLP